MITVGEGAIPEHFYAFFFYFVLFFHECHFLISVVQSAGRRERERGVEIHADSDSGVFSGEYEGTRSRVMGFYLLVFL